MKEQKSSSERASIYIKTYESNTKKVISKGTRSKIEKLFEVMKSNKYEHLSVMLKRNESYKILIHFLLLSDKLKIDRKFKTEAGEYYFNLSYEYFKKVFCKHSKATFNRNVNVFVVLAFFISITIPFLH